MPLNVNAPVFVPAEPHHEHYVCDAESDYSEDNITEEELAEIEATEEWCAELADLEELESNHLIELALRLAPPAQVREIEERFKF